MGVLVRVREILRIIVTVSVTVGATVSVSESLSTIISKLLRAYVRESACLSLMLTSNINIIGVVSAGVCVGISLSATLSVCAIASLSVFLRVVLSYEWTSFHSIVCVPEHLMKASVAVFLSTIRVEQSVCNWQNHPENVEPGIPNWQLVLPSPGLRVVLYLIIAAS